MAARNSLATADDRALALERVFDAPIGLVWKCWTEPQHLTQWSAPRGFTVHWNACVGIASMCS